MLGTNDQHVFSRMKLFKATLLFFLPIAVILALLFSLFSYVKIQSEEVVLAAHEWSHVEIGQKSILHEFETVASTLNYLANSVVLKNFLASKSDQHYADLSQEYLTLIRVSKLYDQIRFLSAEGMEQIRVNFNQGKPHLVETSQLQNKANRYYFSDTFSLTKGNIFVSPFDLNIEHGQVETPHKPMIRFGTPVFDEQGRKQGIVLLNYLGRTVLERLREVMSLNLHNDRESTSNRNHFITSSPMLVNQHGYWLLGLEAEDEWGFMFIPPKQTMEQRYPKAWQAIASEDRGQVVTGNGMFTFISIYPLQVGQTSTTGSALAFQASSKQLSSSEYCWKLISFVSHPELKQFYWHYIRFSFVLYGILLILLFPASYYLGRLRLLKQKAEESLHRYAFIVNKSRDLMTLIDDEYRYLAVSDSFCRIHGQPREKIVGSTIPSVWGADIFTTEIKPNVDLCLAGDLVSYSVWFTITSGKRRYYDITLSPFHDQKQQNHYTVMIARDITERQQMKEELQNVQQDWEATFNAVPDFICLLDTNFKMTRVNRAMAESLGLSPEECIGRTCYGEVHGLDAPPPDCPHAKLLADGKGHAAELVEDRLGGDFLVTVSPLHNSSGQLTGSVHIARDITTSNRARKQLQGLKELKEMLLLKGALQDKLQSITDEVVKIFEADFARIWLVSSGDQCQSGCFHADPEDGIHTCASHDLCLHLKASSRRYRHLDGKAHARVPLGSYKIGRIGSGEEESFITNDVCHDPRIHNHEWARDLGLQAFAGYRLTDQEGKPLGVLAVFSQNLISDEEDAQLAGVANSTAQIIRTAQAEEAMLDSHARLQTILDNVDAMITITDMQSYEILMINQYVLDIFGDIKGKKCWQAIQKDQGGPCAFCQIQGLMDRDAALSSKVWEIKNTRNQRWYECHDTQIRWIDDRLVRLQIATDITERKETEAELHKYASVQKSLLREVNHRVKNNLAAIIGMLYMEDERAEGKTVVNYRETLQELITRIQGLATVHSLLSASEWQPISLSYLCEEVARASLSGLPPNKHIDLVVQDNNVHIDSNQAHYLALVINELTTNSIKHALHDRDSATISIMVAEHVGNQLSMSFQDDGPGYSKAICDGDMSQANVGMEIVEGIISKSLRGSVTFSNSNGALTLFSFTNSYNNLNEESYDTNN